MKWGTSNNQSVDFYSPKLVTDQIGEASFCPRFPSSNRFYGPYTYIFRVNPSQSIAGEHWWFFYYGAYFYKVDGYGTLKDSDCIEGKYLLNDAYQNGLIGNEADYGLPYPYSPGTEGWSKDNGLDGNWRDPYYSLFRGVGKDASGVKQYNGGGPYYGSFLYWTELFGYGTNHWAKPATMPWLEVVVHTWLQPTKTNTPTPANAATGISTTPTLRWNTEARISYGDGYYDYDTQEGLSTEFDIHFGTVSTPPFLVTVLSSSGGSEGSYVIPYALQAGTTYYWRVDAVNWDCNRQRQVTTGDVWTFTTA
jgi:hypothetical protein